MSVPCRGGSSGDAATGLRKGNRVQQASATFPRRPAEATGTARWRCLLGAYDLLQAWGRVFTGTRFLSPLAECDRLVDWRTSEVLILERYLDRRSPDL